MVCWCCKPNGTGPSLHTKQLHNNISNYTFSERFPAQLIIGQSLAAFEHPMHTGPIVVIYLQTQWNLFETISVISVYPFLYLQMPSMCSILLFTFLRPLNCAHAFGFGYKILYTQQCGNVFSLRFLFAFKCLSRSLRAWMQSKRIFDAIESDLSASSTTANKLGLASFPFGLTAN